MGCLGANKGAIERFKTDLSHIAAEQMKVMLIAKGYDVGEIIYSNCEGGVSGYININAANERGSIEFTDSDRLYDIWLTSRAFYYVNYKKGIYPLVLINPRIKIETSAPTSLNACPEWLKICGRLLAQAGCFGGSEIRAMHAKRPETKMFINNQSFFE
jgi:hypothetical protein